ncbi:MAG: hypothetical protein LOD90_08085 [Symbiobacteriaceae bacterium]
MFTFTPQAAQKLNEIIRERGGNLALSIVADPDATGGPWRLTLVPRRPSTPVVGGVPVEADAHAQQMLDGMIIDWVMTPDGPGLGIYDRNLVDNDPRRRGRL